MSQMTINCPHCSQQVLGDTAYAGQTLACPNCGGEFVMPGEAPAQQTQGGTAPAPQLKSRGRPQLKTGGAPRRQGVTQTAGQRAAQQQQMAAQQQMGMQGQYGQGMPGQQQMQGQGQYGQGMPGQQQMQGQYGQGMQGQYQPGMHGMYQSGPGFGKLFADPVAGQRIGCDGMGPAKCLILGLIFLFAVPLVSKLLEVAGAPTKTMPASVTPGAGAVMKINFGSGFGSSFGSRFGSSYGSGFGPNFSSSFSGFGKKKFVDHLLEYMNSVVSIVLIVLAFWLIRLMSARVGRFGETLLVFSIACLWVVVFSLISYGMTEIDPRVAIFVQAFIPCLFFFILYGIFRNLYGVSGTAAFWLTPVALTAGLWLNFGYFWVYNKIAN